MTQKTHVKYWTLFFDTMDVADWFLETKGEQLLKNGVEKNRS